MPNSHDEIEVPPNGTALILTEESVWVSKKITGSYHSKVGVVSLGIGHIGTTLDPGWVGQSLIAVHNHTNDPIAIPVGSTFVSLMLLYLNTPASRANANQAGRPELVNWKGLTHEEHQELEEDWRITEVALRSKLKSSDNHKALFFEQNQSILIRSEKINKAFWYVLKYIVPQLLIIAVTIFSGWWTVHLIYENELHQVQQQQGGGNK